MEKTIFAFALVVTFSLGATAASGQSEKMAAPNSMMSSGKMAMPDKMAPSGNAEVLAALKRWTADFNKNDMKAFVGACATKASVIDVFPPYAWDNCADWMAANEAQNKALQASEGVLTLGKTLHVEITGDRAYVVVAAKYVDKEKGKSVTQSATWSVTLEKAAGGWAFTGSAWAVH